jgi:eukaryotic-like serine/threonine-protein kinase
LNDHRMGNGIGSYRSCLILILLILLLTPSAIAADMMFRASPERTGIFDNSGIVPNNAELWRFETRSHVRSSPTVSNGVVYVGSDALWDGKGTLHAIDAVTGEEKWRFKTKSNMRSAPAASYTFSSPAVSNGVVYVGSDDENLYAIDAMTGTEKWRFVTGDIVLSSPAVSNGIVYVGSRDNKVYSIDAVTGEEKWRFVTGSNVLSSLAVSDGFVYAGSADGNLYAIDTMTGTEKWRLKTGDTVLSSPAVSNGIVYIGSWDNKVYSIDAVTGTEKWRFVTGSNVESSPAVSNGVVYIGSWDNNLYAIDTMTGTEKWRFKTGDTVLSSPAISNGVVYVGSRDNKVYSIDAVTGEEKWRFETGGYVDSSPAVSNGVVYVGSADGKLYAIGGALTSQINTQTPSSTQTVATNSASVTPAVATPGIEHTSPSLLLSNSVYSRLSPPIIVILAILFFATGGYGLYRLKKKPSDYQPLKRKDKKAIAPHSPPTGATTKPELDLRLDRSQLIAGYWDRMTIQLVNRGNVSVKDIRLTFSDEFDTKWIKPATINAGATISLDIGIRPKFKGKLPLEVMALYRDDHDKEFRETHEFWIDVVEKATTTSQSYEIPSSPVGKFTPKPLTPKQLPPDLSDRYTESEFIGKGGFAQVFKAKRRDGKYVAVKIPISVDALTGRSFITEMQNWTKLSHPNIVRLYDFNIMPLPYFEEELCDSALADQNKPVECEKAAWILFNICEGLKFAHAQRIIHRDLKPQNILLKNGVPKISDWGLSRIISDSTTTTVTSFTPHYAAPEQINNRVKDERTDIWQLGVILYELVTAILPFNGGSMVEIGMNIATKDPKRPGEIQPEAHTMDSVVMKCLQKDPAKRYQSVLELQKDLAVYLRRNYTELLKMSVTAHDNNRSAFYCGDLVMVNLLTGDMKSAYKYLLDFVQYSRGDVKVEAQELCEQIKMRMEMGVTEIPDELIQKAESLVHRAGVGFRNLE